MGDCGCGCGGAAATTSVPNPPGASAIRYRSGTQAQVLRRMLGALATRLPELTVRQTDDAAVALLDAFATVADVVTFYTERIAQEGFLRTSTERFSVLELARAIGYELRPGVAAAAYLAFAVETAPGAPASAVVPAGLRVRSVPAQNEVPQPFETSAALTAYAGRNELTLRRSRPQPLDRGRTSLYLAGLDTGLAPGDGILVVGDERLAYAGSERWDFRIVRTVTPLPAAGPDATSRTLITWDVGIGLDRDRPTPLAEQNVQVYAFRQRAALFGYNAPDWRTMPKEVRARYAGQDAENVTQWPGFALPGPGQDPVIDLDAPYPAVGPGSWLVLRRPGYEELYRITRAEPNARQDYGITGKTTRVWLDAREHLSWFGIRETAVYARTELLTLAEEPLTEPVTGPDLPLAAPLSSTLDAGAPVVISGVTADGTATTVVGFAAAHPPADLSVLRLAAALDPGLRPDSVRIQANVVAATHGETVAEVLGSGDGAATHQRFRLRRPDLTHVSAPTAAGVADTLTVTVNDVAWAESPSLFPLGPHDRDYIVRIGDDGYATVIFGDGVRGARLPTGSENVKAAYRTGIGPAGNVGAGALSLLQQRPLGIRSVGNPLPAAGGAAREELADARANAPLTVLTLDRVVSLRDHEDFARTFAGVAKARAVALWSGTAFFVHLTVAGPDATELPDSTMTNLRAALDTVRDRTREVVVHNFRRLGFRVAVAVLVDPAYGRDAVFAATAAAVRDAYGFDRRAFGQPVTAAEVITVVQGVPGVVAVNLTALYPTGAPVSAQEVLLAPDARIDTAGHVSPAALLLVDADGITVGEMAP
jgi:predicted phage baseplate assembly protein